MPNGSQLYGGTLGDFDQVDNMAQEIETAFEYIRTAAQPVGAGITQPLPTGANAQDMRLLFVAIARGVIQHLVKNPGAFQVTVQSGNLVGSGGVTSVSAMM
jgi:hypothetical protein